MAPKPRKSDLWTADNELTLIDYMKQRPYMWDSNNRDFYQTELKRRAFQECASLIGSQITGEMVRDRWTNMRTTFASNYKRAQQKHNSFTATDEDAGNPPSWSLYNSLLFLEPTVAARRSMGKQQQISLVSREGLVGCKMEDEGDQPFCQIAETTGAATIAPSGMEFDGYEYEGAPKDASSKYSSEGESSFVEMIATKDDGHVFPETHARGVVVVKEGDEWDDFGKMVSKILRNMSEKDAREVQVEFFKILLAKSQRNS